MSKFFTVKHPLTVTVGGQTHEFFVREIGYLEYMQIQRKVISELTEENKDLSGIALMTATVLEAVEEPDGTPSYTAEEWRLELKDAALQIGKAALKAQGIDLDAVKEEKPLTEKQVEGNAEPSRKSGTNSPSSLAAQSAN